MRRHLEKPATAWQGNTPTTPTRPRPNHPEATPVRESQVSQEPGVAGALPCHAVAGFSRRLLGLGCSPLANSMVVAPWPWWFLSVRSPLAVSWPPQFLLVGSLVVVPSGRAFSSLVSAFAGRRLFASSRSCLHCLFSPFLRLWGCSTARALMSPFF